MSVRPGRRRRKGSESREEIIAKRSRPPAINPTPPSAVGEQYKPLSDIQIQQIYDTAIRMLAELGMLRLAGKTH